VSQNTGGTNKELNEAAALAEKLFPDIGLKTGDYKLVRAENFGIPGGDYLGPKFWYLTFKLRTHIPDTAEEPLTAGGEIFIEVDLDGGKASLSGHGE
jgi:hypothetical protein